MPAVIPTGDPITSVLVTAAASEAAAIMTRSMLTGDGMPSIAMLTPQRNDEWSRPPVPMDMNFIRLRERVGYARAMQIYRGY